ncbi:WecB/TagA/CpsF family glycosyltransferase [Ningiella sp. W23]|uniref:WecB/TagA/CpsF family glycosyltransferase n=1 Tax=Ningiella sp. W23 TaxID=3023715 RepID=UPI0037572225
MKTAVVGGMETVCVSNTALAEKMVNDCLAARETKQRAKVVFSSNGQGIALFGSDPSFQSTMKSADIIHADGQSVVFASKLLCKNTIPERIATTDFFHDAARAAQESGLTFYMFGATEQENKIAVENIKSAYPNLKIVGRRNGYFSKEEESEIIDEINELKPDVVWVALGKPMQEFWCMKMRSELNVGWLKTCGGLYAFLAGSVSRAPKWMQNAGLEWVFRMLNEPRKYFWRYLITNPKAIFYMLTNSK